MTILIVDDNEQNLYQLQVLLGGSGYRVVSAANGTEALAKARQNPPDLVISDILMPVMDGFALCREWKQDARLRPIPFVFYTATYTDERDREFALSLGAERFLVKPEEPDVFIRTLREVIEEVRRRPAGSAPAPGGAAPDAESGYLKQYNEALIRKLETKMQQLENTNRELEKDIAERKRVEVERQRLQAQLLQSQKLEAIGTLASGVAHEINNPIMGIMGHTEMIIESVGADSPVAGLAIEIGKATQRVAAIVKNLLSFARFDKQNSSPARLCDIVEGTLSLTRAVLRHDRIALTVEVAETLPLIDCRTQQIQQVIMNLLTNARDALNARYPGPNESKKIVITAKRLEGRGKGDGEGRGELSCLPPLPSAARPFVRLTVEDHGSGISPDIRDRIFTPFFTTKLRDKGTGLGLSISHGIVKDHGGALWFESEAGQWTRFHVDLPAA